MGWRGVSQNAGVLVIFIVIVCCNQYLTGLCCVSACFTLFNWLHSCKSSINSKQNVVTEVCSLGYDWWKCFRQQTIIQTNIDPVQQHKYASLEGEEFPALYWLVEVQTILFLKLLQIRILQYQLKYTHAKFLLDCLYMLCVLYITYHLNPWKLTYMQITTDYIHCCWYISYSIWEMYTAGVSLRENLISSIICLLCWYKYSTVML